MSVREKHLELQRQGKPHAAMTVWWESVQKDLKHEGNHPWCHVEKYEAWLKENGLLNLRLHWDTKNGPPPKLDIKEQIK